MTKIDIISGFLGSGKTTFIKKILEEKFLAEKVVLIENEFGQIGIDGILFKKSGIEIRELNSGCICCSLVGDFERTIQEVIEKFKPERIIIEPSGVGKLSEIIKACEAAKQGESLHINMLITVVDVLKLDIYLANFGEFFENQIKYAKTILLSKTQKASPEKVEKAVNTIQKINAKANIVTTPWEELSAEKILAIAEGDGTQALENEIKELLQRGMESEGCHCGHNHATEHHHDCCAHEHHHHDADEIFTVWGKETPRIFSVEELRKMLVSLENADAFGDVLRGKGILQVENGAWVQFDYVPEEIQMSEISPDYTGKVCIIGSQLNTNALEKLFFVTN
ncbi:MAG: CobW family GTP-binding protein [Anaerotignum sp.]|nr:CobW family GTP-binding protein [Anaerotignum sp.]